MHWAHCLSNPLNCRTTSGQFLVPQGELHEKGMHTTLQYMKMQQTAQSFKGWILTTNEDVNEQKDQEKWRKRQPTYRSRKHFFQQLQDYQQNHLLLSTTEQTSSFLVEIIRTCNKQENWGCCASQWGYNSPMVNLVLTIRPRLTITTSLHHHGMSLNKQHTVSCYTLSCHTT